VQRPDKAPEEAERQEKVADLRIATRKRKRPFHVITTGAVGEPLGPDPSGIRVVVVRESTTESRYYGLGNIP